MSFYLSKSSDSIWTGQFTKLKKPGLIHAVSTRFGGVSKAPYDSLNLALHVGDEAADVIENRKLFCRAVGVSFSGLTTPEQVHGDKIFRVTEKDAGRGSLSYDDSIKGTDALMTNVRGISLMLCYADCTPLLFFDPVNMVIAAAHGGWKGTYLGIAGKTLMAMQESYGSRPENVITAIGPAIGPSCYEVGEEVAEKFRTAYPEDASEILVKDGEKIHLDLWAANRMQLLHAGIREENIDSAETCTQHNAEVFYSYRAAGGTTGRIAALISLE